MGLNCYCDHCPNNTCTITEGGLCYAEWTTTNPGYPENNNIQHHSSQHLLANQARNFPLQLEKKFNCFQKDHILFQSIVCNETVSNTSNIIRKCCNEKDYCNAQENLLPTEEQAHRLFEIYLPLNTNKQSFGQTVMSTIQQYSNLPLEVKIVLTVLLGLLFIFSVTITYNSLTKRRLQRMFMLKGQLASLMGAKRRTYHGSGALNGSSSQNGASTSRAGYIVSTTTTNRRHGDEDCSENSSAKANSDVAVYDTNSMASREPLLNSSHQRNNNLGYQPPPRLDHQHPAPFMTDETFNGRTASTFQMTIGTGTEVSRADTSSGSGAGQPYLTQRSIAHDIELVEVVGRGFFGVVWRGEYKGEPVAVKIFSPMAELSWEREAEIYQTTMLRHKNILGFIATDKRHDAAMTGYWLVTDYYPMGSLCDFLQENSLSMADAMRMAFSVANGLSHLHVEIFGTQGKPAIAHRDLKSKNILVKNDGTCCIADLGMAVRYNSSTGIVDVPTNSRVGTRRYLAPEILENRLNLMDFEAVKATDIYALGLVLWEILRRTCLVHPSDNAFITIGTYSDSFEINLHDTAPTSVGTTRSNSASPAKYHQYTIGAAPSNAGNHPKQLMSKPEAAPSSALQPTSSGAQGYLVPPTLRTLDPTQQQQIQEYSIETAAIFDEVTNNDLAKLCDPYEAPYQQYVSTDPSTDEMRLVVCVQKIRPQLSIRWTKIASMREYVALMSECWYEKPQSRLSALRVRKSLGDLARKYFNFNMEYD